VRSIVRAGPKWAYLRELLIAVNLALMLASIPATATKIPSAMPEAIRQYSTAVAAVSSAMNLRTAFLADNERMTGATVVHFPAEESRENGVADACA
jgi:hypothetical protein